MSSTWLLTSATMIALVSSSPTQPGFDRSDRPQPVDTMIDVGDHRLHFRAWAGSGNLTIVFEAGGGADLTAWATVPSLLAARIPARIVAYDRAGMGQSDVGPRDLTPQQEIEQLDRALDKLGVRRMVLVGHSYGGAVITNAATG
ncbi:MAG: alpha/beta hydrolase, partial [Gemmatimonadota bacterium]